MNKKIFTLVFGMFLLVGALAPIVSADYVFENTTGTELMHIFSENGNLSVLGNISTGEYFVGSGKYLTDIDASALNLSETNYWTKDGTDLYYSLGNVGIGTTSPSYKLDVAGTMNAYDLKINGTSITTGANISGAGSNNYLSKWAGSSFLGNSVVYDDGSNVGIGTTSPSQKLQVDGNVIFNSFLNMNGTASGAVGQGPAIQFSSDSTADYSIIQQSTDGLDFWGYSGSWTNYLKIDQSGNIGAGTTSPGAKLHLGSSDSINTPVGDMVMSRYWASSTDTRASSIYHFSDGVTDRLIFGVSGDYSGGNNWNKPNQISMAKMVIGADGNVGIGTTTPQNELNVIGTVNASSFVGDGSGITGITGSQINNDLNWINSSEASDLTVNNSDKLDGYDASFFMPLNTSVVGDFDFNGGWTSGGVSIVGGNIYAQSGYFYDINALSVTNLEVNGSLIPDLDNTFDVGNSSMKWRNGYFGGDLVVGGVIDAGINPGLTTGSVVFQGASGLTEDNDNFFWDDGTNRLAIGGNELYTDGTGDFNIESSRRFNLRALEKPELVGYSNTTQKWKISHDGTNTQLLSNSGIFSIINTDTGKDLRFQTESTDRLTIDGATGNVGIGTTAPSFDLDVAGNMRSTGYLYAGGHLSFMNSGIHYIKHGGGTAATDKMTFRFSDNEDVMTIAGDGNVGIGTTSPDYKLEVVDSNSANTQAIIRNDNAFYPAGLKLRAQNKDVNTWEVMSIGDGGAFGDGALRGFSIQQLADSTPNLFIDTTGNVGIGTTSPSYKLDVAGTMNAYDLKINGTSITTGANISGAGSNNYLSKWAGSSVLGNSVVYDDGSNVGIGTTSPGSKLDVAGIAKATTLTDGFITMSYAQINRAGNPIELQYGAPGDLQIFGNTAYPIYFESTNGNVGIGTTSPGAKLEVSRPTTSGTISNFRYIGSINGNYGDIDFVTQHTGSINYIASRIRSISPIQGGAGDANGELAFFTQPGTNTNAQPLERVRIDKSGNVGIGTTSPGHGLEIAKSDAANFIAKFRNGAGDGKGLLVQAGTTADHIVFQAQHANAANEGLVVKADGNVGIGTASPAEKLEVNGTILIDTAGNAGGAGIALKRNGAANRWTLIQGHTATNDFEFLEGSNTRLMLKSGGNVGIGTANPTSNLQLGDPDSGSEEVLYITGSGTGSAEGGQIRLAAAADYDTSFDSWYMDVWQDNLRIFDGTTTRFRIDQSTGYVSLNEGGGNVGIGTSSPDTALHVASGGTTDIKIEDTAGSIGGWRLRAGNANANDFAILSGTSNTRMTIDAGGNVGIGTTSPNAAVILQVQGTGPANWEGGAAFGDSNAAVIMGQLNNVAQIGGHTGALDGWQDLAINSGGGNVGIGTTSPGAKLDVNGKILISNTGSGNYGNIADFNTPSDGDRITVYNDGTSYDSRIGVGSTSNLWIKSFGETVDEGTIELFTGRDTSTPALKILGNGNVGIGTTTPGAKLNVVGKIKVGSNSVAGINAKVDIRQSSDTITEGVVWANAAATNQKGIYHDGTNLHTDGGFIFDSNVGIGDTSPSVPLQVNGKTFVDTSATYTTNYVWGNSALQTNSLEIMDRYGGSTSDGVYPTLLFHDFGNGGAQFTMDGSTEILHLASGNTNSAGTLQTNNDYFSELRVHGIVSGTQFCDETGANCIDASSGIGNLSGAGTTNYLSKWAGSSVLGNSVVYDDGSNVGIGTSNPSYPLEVSSNPGNGQLGRFVRTGTGGAWLELANTVGEFGLGTNNGEFYLYDRNDTEYRMVVDTSGKVGIGTTSPQGKLEVVGNIVLNNEALDHGTDEVVGQLLGQARSYGGDENTGIGSIAFRTDATSWYKGSITFSTNNVDGTDPAYPPTERMRITSAGNVGIGTTSPSSKLEVTGTSVGGVYYGLTTSNEDTSTTGTGAGINFVVDGVNDVSGATIRGERTASAYHSSKLAFATRDSAGAGMVDRMTIDSSGNTGIGTTSPTVPLEVAGTIMAQDTYGTIRIKGTGGLSRLQFADSADDDVGLIEYNHISNYLTFTTNANEKMRIDENGNVGIGTTSPSQKLEVSGNIRSLGVGGMLGDDFVTSGQNEFGESGWSLYTKTATPLSLGVDNSRSIVIDTSGNVGIGTTTPGAKLDVSGIIRSNLGTSGALELTGSTYKIEGGSNFGDIRFSAPRFRFYEDGSTFVMGIDGGNVGIGTTSPGAKLDVAGALRVGDGSNFGTNDGGILLYSNNAYKIGFDNVGGSVGYIRHNVDSADSIHGHIFSAGSIASPTDLMLIRADGNVGIGTTSPGSKLHVNSSSSGLYSAKFENYDADGHGVRIFTNNEDTNRGSLVYANPSGTQFYLRNDGALGLGYDYSTMGTGTLQVNGNVGIGTTSPATKLHTVGYTTIDGVDVVAAFSSNNANKRVNIGYSTSGDYGFINAVDSGVLWKDLIFNQGGGNVGIGDTTPDSKLDVEGTITADGVQANAVENLTIDGTTGTGNVIIKIG